MASSGQPGRDVHRFLRDLEKSLIQTVAHFGVAAFVKPGLTGVWTGTGKLASIGISVSRWITKHGFALNVNTDLSYFELIHPCGILNCPVTSLSDLLGGPVDLREVKRVFQCSFEKCLGARARRLEPAALLEPTRAVRAMGFSSRASPE